jgi:hypothetical protein
MAAALQNEMKDSMTVVATTTLVAFDRAWMFNAVSLLVLRARIAFKFACEVSCRARA